VDNQDSLTIKVLEKEYRVACPSDEKKYLQASAKMLNEKLNEIKAKGSVIGTERIAVMAALNMSHDVISNSALVDKHEKLNNRIDTLSAKIDSTMREIKQV
jgi:cell division protein ZapA